MGYALRGGQCNLGQIDLRFAIRNIDEMKRTMHPSSSTNDPRPVEPPRPDDDACCHGGCDLCIFDLFEEALEQYRVDLRAWEERQHRAGRA
jgi:hypothetical protein